MNNPEFEVHLLNEEGIQNAKDIAFLFDGFLDKITGYCSPGRELSIVKTKLEEASFFAKKSMAKQSQFQKAE